MSEYYTRPDDPVAGTRIRVAKIKEILDSIDDGFDEIPADLVSIAAEVIAARDGKDALLDQIDELQADILSNTNDIVGLGSAELPGQTGSAGKYLTTNGSVSSWDDPLPSLTGNAGKVLTTDGTDTSWGDPLRKSFLL